MPSKPRIILSGSLAYDYIMDFPGTFREHILPEYTHMLNVSFAVDTLQKNMGGCAGNIGYTMRLLGAEPIIVGALGKDAETYRAHLAKEGIADTHILMDETLHTASGFITTDKDNNQIAAFYTGAGKSAEKQTTNHIPADFAIITAGEKKAMLTHARECKANGIETMIDPSHQLPVLSKEELEEIITGASWYIANDYEMKLTEDKLGKNMSEILSLCSGVIVTFGKDGSLIKTQTEEYRVPSVPVFSVTDPTGAGDAFRAGVATFLQKGHDYISCLRAGSVCAAYAIEHYGSQCHRFTTEEWTERYMNDYGEHPNTAL